MLNLSRLRLRVVAKDVLQHRWIVLPHSRTLASVAATVNKLGSPGMPMGRRREISPSEPRKAPTSLMDYAESKGHFSVTDLTSPAWCEYAYQYGILGMRHLPVALRPKEIVTPAGKVVKADKKAVETREKILKRGRKVHAKLEDEIHPVKVQIETTSKEERWGVRLLRIVTGLHTLMDSGCCRELPVFGYMEGKMVMGVIDEISKRPLSRQFNLYLDQVATSEKEATRTLQHFFPTTQQGSHEIPAPPPSKRGQQQWASQEEWRTAKRKSEQAAKLSNKKEKKSVARSPSKADAKQGSLSTFFGGATEASTSSEERKARFGYFLEDSKTRKGQLVPPVEDQFQARMQCMLYKRLFDGLLAGAFEHDRHADGKEAEALALDPNAKAVKMENLFDTLGLQADVALSEAFIRDAEELLHGYNLTIQPLDPESNIKVACTLNTIATLLRESLVALARSARAGLGWKSSFDQPSGALQSRLRLTYRKHKKNKSSKESSLEHSKTRRRSERQAAKVAGEKGALIADGTLERALAKEVGVDSERDEHALEYEILRDNGIIMPPNATSTNVNASNAEKEDHDQEDVADVSGTETTTLSDNDKVATVTFLHDNDKLQAFVLDMLRLWNGKRDLRGVTLEQSWRCHHCEFRRDCEWREQKGKEKLDEATRTQLARKMADRAAAENADATSSESEKEAEKPVKSVLDDEPGRTTISRTSLDDDDTLWSQFEVIADESMDW